MQSEQHNSKMTELKRNLNNVLDAKKMRKKWNEFENKKELYNSTISKLHEMLDQKEKDNILTKQSMETLYR